MFKFNLQLIDPATQLPPPHIEIGPKTVYAIEDAIPYTVRIEWGEHNLAGGLDSSMVELLLGVDGHDGLSDAEEYEDAPRVALSSSGIVLDQGVFMRGCPWFEGHRDRRGDRELMGVVWAALFMPSEQGGEAQTLPCRLWTQKSTEIAWTRSKNPRHRFVRIVEFDTHDRLMKRGIFVPLLNPYGPPEAL